MEYWADDGTGEAKEVVCYPYKYTSCKNNGEQLNRIERLRLEGQDWREADRGLKPTESMN